MTTTKVFCDICGKEFTGDYWDNAPSGVKLTMTGPGANHGKLGVVFDFKDTCHGCRHGIIGAINRFVESQKP